MTINTTLDEAIHGLRIAVQALAHASQKDATYKSDYERVDGILHSVTYNAPFCHRPLDCSPEGRCMNQEKTGFACNH